MKKTTIIIPVFNEENTIVELLGKLKSLDIEKEIIIIDDGSTDSTREILFKIKDDDIKIIFNEENRGKGSAIISGIKLAGGEMIVIQDADLEYDPNELVFLVDTMVKNDYKVLYGSRFMKNKFPAGMSAGNYVANKILNLAVLLLFNFRITDEATCYKLFRADVLKKMDLKCKGFEFCPEVTAKLLRNKIKIYEVPISYTGRKNKDGKKIKWTDGFIAVWTLVKNRFN